MARLIFRRVLQSIPLLLAISAVTFFLLFHSPGDFMAELKLNPRISQEFLEHEKIRLGLDKAWYVVWAKWLWGAVRHGDFGRSYSTNLAVSTLIVQRLFNTFLLALASTIFSWLLAVPLGIAAAVKKDKLVDRIASAIAFLGLSVPAVLLSLLAIYFAAVTGLFPVGQMRSDTSYAFTSNWAKAKDIAHHLFLPAVVLGAGALAIYTRQMRSNLLETLETDYVRTARAKGATYWSAVMRHALRNALNPLISLFGFAFSELLSGAFLVENVFAWPGLGRTTVIAYTSKDTFVVAASVMMASVMLIAGNLLADVLLAWNDPRIRYE